MKLVQKFLTFSRAKQIVVAVCLAHFFFIFCLLGHHLATRRWKTPRPMVVRTVMAQKPVSLSVPSTSPKPAVKTQPVLPSKPPPAKTPPPPALKPQPAPSLKPSKGIQTKPKAEAKKTPLPPPKETALKETALKEIAQSFDALSQETKKPRPTLSLPPPLQPKSEPPPVSETDPTYGEFLIAFLQRTLDLPEYGEVKLKVEIDRFGKLIDCEILEAKSAKNAAFLKNQLPELTFPCLNDFDILESTQTFNITFRNVETH